MSRGLTSAMLSAIAADTVRPVHFAKLSFASTTIYICDAAADISLWGLTWRGNGWLQPIKAISETTGIKSSGCEITLTGAVTDLIALTLDEPRLTNKCFVYLGFFDEQSELLDDPVLVFQGNLDKATISQSVEEFIITLEYESDLKGLTREREFRYTQESQKSIFPDDLGFQYVKQMETWDGFWGKPERPKWYYRKKK